MASTSKSSTAKGGRVPPRRLVVQKTTAAGLGSADVGLVVPKTAAAGLGSAAVGRTVTRSSSAVGSAVVPTTSVAGVGGEQCCGSKYIEFGSGSRIYFYVYR